MQVKHQDLATSDIDYVNTNMITFIVFAEQKQLVLMVSHCYSHEQAGTKSNYNNSSHCTTFIHDKATNNKVCHNDQLWVHYFLSDQCWLKFIRQHRRGDVLGTWCIPSVDECDGRCIVGVHAGKLPSKFGLLKATVTAGSTQHIQHIYESNETTSSHVMTNHQVLHWIYDYRFWWRKKKHYFTDSTLWMVNFNLVDATTLLNFLPVILCGLILPVGQAALPVASAEGLGTRADAPVDSDANLGSHTVPVVMFPAAGILVLLLYLVIFHDVISQIFFSSGNNKNHKSSAVGYR